MSSTDASGRETQVGRTLTRLEGRYAIIRFGPHEPVPPWALAGDTPFTSITRTSDELSVICPVEAVPADIRPAGWWSGLRLEGPFALDEPGVLASVVGPLARAGLSLFAVATFDTDYLLVSEVDAAAEALAAAGHQVLAAATAMDGEEMLGGRS